MDTNLKVTDQPEEIAFDDIVAGDQIINIPLFQRAYKWTEKNIIQFWEDINSIVDGSSRSHFLGVLVLVPQGRRVGQPALLDIVDGQQRLTTCYLAILSMVQAAAEINETEWAVEVARGYLLTRSFSNYATNTKLIPSAADRQQFHDIWTRIVGVRNLETVDWRGDLPSTPQPSGDNKGRMATSYQSLLRRTRQIAKEEGIEGLQKIFDIIFGKLSFVTINLRSPTAAPAIFERLNARGEKITISDLVRNEIFSRVADKPSEASTIFSNYWEPFIGNFRSKNIEFELILFPYGLTINSNITKADLFQELRNHWGESHPRDIIKSIDKFTPIISSLENGEIIEELPQNFSKKLAKLSRVKAPSSLYPFLFMLSASVQDDELDADNGCEVIDVVESFLVRRAVCGIEPTGLHAVFKGLWGEVKQGVVSGDRVRTAISRRSTVPWPSDDEFKTAICTLPLYGKRVASYLLLQYESGLEGETPEDEFQIEHVYPTTPHKEWEIESDEYSDRIRNTWGNLIPLTKAMNPSLLNGPYHKKKASYLESVFATARKLGREHDTWSIKTIELRNEELAQWATQRWPYSRSR